MTDACAVIAALSPDARHELEVWLAESERRMRIKQYYLNPLQFAQEIFPHRYYRPFAPMHQEIVRMVFPLMESPCLADTHSLPRSTATDGGIEPILTAIAAPRGFGKSEMCSFLLPIWSCCLNRTHFIIILGESEGKAAEWIKAIRIEWETNERLRKALPHIKPNQKKWSDTQLEWIISGKLSACILGLGRGMPIRGRKFLHWRPQLIVLDDIENEESVDSEIQREDTMRWLETSVLYAESSAHIVAIGTILGERSYLNRIVRQAEERDQRAYRHWRRRVFRAIEDERSTWENYETTRQLLVMRERNPEAFLQEKQNEPIGVGYKSFDKPEFWTEQRWWHDLAELPQDLMISLTVDPAATNREYSDETALNVSGWDADGALCVLDKEHGKYVEPDWLLERIFYLYAKWSHQPEHPGWRFYCVGIEKVGFQKFLIHLFEQECRKRQIRPHVVELKGDRDKTRRIRQLVPLFAQNRIKLRADMLSLELQLRAFPKGAHDDEADALAAHIQLAHTLPTKTTKPPERPTMTLTDYMRLADAQHRQRELLLPYANALPDASFVPVLWTPN